MKKALTVLGVVLITLILGFGCSGNGGGDGDSSSPMSTTPVIKSHKLLLINVVCAENYFKSEEFCDAVLDIIDNCVIGDLTSNPILYVGNVVLAGFLCEDADLDPYWLHNWQYLKVGNQWVFQYDEGIELEQCTEISNPFWVGVPYTIQTPGEWKFVVQLTDDQNHLSNKYPFYVTIYSTPQSQAQSVQSEAVQVYDPVEEAEKSVAGYLKGKQFLLNEF